jgi:ankyrin repeat protein
VLASDGCLGTTTEPFGPRIDADGRTSLHRAVISGDDATAQRILNRGKVDPKAKDKSSRTALYYAMQNSRREVALSLARKSNVPDETVIANLNNPTDTYKAGALFSAIKEKKSIEIGFLIEIGVNIQATGYGGWPSYRGTPLHEAAIYGTPEIVRLLLDNGANKNTRDAYGNLPTAPTWTSSPEIVRLLS